MSDLSLLPKRYVGLLNNTEVQHIKLVVDMSFKWSVFNTTITNEYTPEFDYDERVCDSFSAVALFYSDIEGVEVDTNAFLVRYGKKIANQVAADLGLKIKKYVRMKVNILFNDFGVKEGQFNCPHKDTQKKNTISIVYYIDDCDGDTYVFPNFNKETRTLGEPLRFEPQSGTAIAFESMMYHASSNPFKHNRRYIINIVFEYEEE